MSPVNFNGLRVLDSTVGQSLSSSAYDTRVKDRGLRFDAANAGATFVTDRETHSTWNAYSLAVKGPLKGTQLKPLTCR